MSANISKPKPQNVLQRLQQSSRAARRAGFKIRAEWLDGETAGWCEFAGSRWIFVDLSLPVIEQIAQIDEALATYCRRQAGKSDRDPVRQAPNPVRQAPNPVRQAPPAPRGRRAS